MNAKSILPTSRGRHFAALPIRLALLISLVAASLSSGRAQEPAPARDPVRVDPATRRVIHDALEYLAAQQSPSGAWFGKEEEERRHPVAITGYVLMAFLAAGHVPDEAKHGGVVSRGIAYLLGQISDDGLFASKHSGQYMYEHGIATIALAEVYGQSRDARLKDRLERLVRIIVSSQNHEGGWRYRPVADDADISVTVLQVVALRAAKNNGLAVPERTLDAAVNYVRNCYAPAAGGFAYQPGDEAGFARTAAAIYSLQVCGEYDDPRVQKGSDYLFTHLKVGSRWFAYGNFYAAPAQYMIGGQVWERWYGQMKEILLPQVRREGGQAYWDKRLDDSSPGPVFNTAVYTLILAMPNHYLPLYQR